MNTEVAAPAEVKETTSDTVNNHALGSPTDTDSVLTNYLERQRNEYKADERPFLAKIGKADIIRFGSGFAIGAVLRTTTKFAFAAIGGAALAGTAGFIANAGVEYGNQVIKNIQRTISDADLRLTKENSTFWDRMGRASEDFWHVNVLQIGFEGAKGSIGGVIGFGAIELLAGTGLAGHIGDRLSELTTTIHDHIASANSPTIEKPVLPAGTQTYTFEGPDHDHLTLPGTDREASSLNGMAEAKWFEATAKSAFGSQVTTQVPNELGVLTSKEISFEKPEEIDLTEGHFAEAYRNLRENSVYRRFNLEHDYWTSRWKEEFIRYNPSLPVQVGSDMLLPHKDLLGNTNTYNISPISKN